MISLNGLTVAYGNFTLLDNIDFHISDNDKIGLVGKNGAGKSTIMKLIVGEYLPTSGSIDKPRDVRIGYLPQIMSHHKGKTVLDETLTAFEEAAGLQKEIDEINSELANRTDYESKEYLGLINRLSELTERSAIGESEPPEVTAEKTLLGLGFRDEDFCRKTETFSQGWNMRIELAKILLAKPDVLLLDEPTNHLDIESIEWLEDYLQRRKVTLLMVTHDRWTLDRVCNRIIEIEGETLYSYDGNYDYYIQKRTERMENREAELGRVRNLLRGELEWMRRQPQARGSKAKYRIDNFYDLEARSHSAGPEKDVRLDVKAGYIGSKIFEARNVCKAFGDKVILRDWSYTFARYEKVGVVGPNGVGKSTFIKILLNRLQPDLGSIDTGQTVKWGYYSQEGITGFDENAKVIDAVRTITDRVRIDDKTTLTAQQFLTRFLFTPKDQQKYIHKLSGGERRRLYLATVLMQEPNFLVLDEPTNDLDIMTLAVLEDYLANFKGCVIVVSHDRYFLDRVAQHLFVFKGDGEIKDFPGDYSTYRHCVAQERAARRSEAAAADPAKKAQKQNRPRTEQKRKMSFKERREYEQLQVLLEELGAERAELEASMNSGTLTHEELSAAGVRIQQIIDETDSSEFRLLELMELED